MNTGFLSHVIVVENLAVSWRCMILCWLIMFSNLCDCLNIF